MGQLLLHSYTAAAAVQVVLQQVVKIMGQALEVEAHRVQLLVESQVVVVEVLVLVVEEELVLVLVLVMVEEALEA
jgi:hypothetical protein